MFKKKFHNSIDKGRYGYLFIAPFFIVFAVFGLYPIVYTFILSFQKWDGLAKMTPLGWKNYARLLTDDVFYLSVWNTIRIWIFNFVPQMLTALLLSALFTFNHIRGMKFFRAAYYLPNLITAASVGLLFNLLFDGNKSVANYILQALHVKGAPFFDPMTAKWLPLYTTAGRFESSIFFCLLYLYAVHLKPNCCVACFNCVRFTPSLPMCTTCPTSTISTSNP